VNSTSAFDASSLWADRARLDPPPFLHKAPDHIVYDFDQGTPDKELFPKQDLDRISHEIISTSPSDVLDYFDHEFGYGTMFMGLEALRAEIAAMVGRRQGRTPEIDEIIIVNGSSNGVSLAGQTFLQSGDAVILEAATFQLASRFFRQSGATPIYAAIDDDGMIPESVEERIQWARANGLRPKMIYTIPTGQLPTGTIMPLERRRRLLEIASTHDLMILEDAMYEPFQYEGERVASIWSMDTEGRVLQSESFSKTVAPSTRTGWMIGSRSAILGMSAVKADLGNSLWMMKTLAQYLKEGLLEPHIARSVEVYHRRRDLADAALAEHCGEYLTWRTPRAGFAFWLTLSDDMPWEEVSRGMFDEGIAMRSGERFLGSDSGAKHLRMSFPHQSDEGLAKGIATFGRVLARTAPAPASRVRA